MCEVVTQKYGAGGGANDLSEGLAQVRKRVQRILTPVAGAAHTENVQDPEDPEFDELTEPGELIATAPEYESAQIGMSLLTGLIGFTPAEMDKLTLS
jgi:hypothetical protein